MEAAAGPLALRVYSAPDKFAGLVEPVLDAAAELIQNAVVQTAETKCLAAEAAAGLSEAVAGSLFGLAEAVADSLFGLAEGVVGHRAELLVAAADSSAD